MTIDSVFNVFACLLEKELGIQSGGARDCLFAPRSENDLVFIDIAHHMASRRNDAVVGDIDVIRND
jgi:hypothetical protein